MASMAACEKARCWNWSFWLLPKMRLVSQGNAGVRVLPYSACEIFQLSAVLSRSASLSPDAFLYNGAQR